MERRFLNEARTLSNGRPMRRGNAAEGVDDDHRGHLLKAMGACLEEEDNGDITPQERYEKLKAIHDHLNPKPEDTEEEDLQGDDGARKVVKTANTDASADANRHESRRFRSARGVTLTEAQKLRDDYLESLSPQERLRWVMS
jgi:hypothetical protein